MYISKRLVWKGDDDATSAMHQTTHVIPTSNIGARERERERRENGLSIGEKAFSYAAATR